MISIIKHTKAANVKQAKERERYLRLKLRFAKSLHGKASFVRIGCSQRLN